VFYGHNLFNFFSPVASKFYKTGKQVLGMTIKLFCFGWSGTISDDRQPVFEAINAVLKSSKKKEVSAKKWASSSKYSPVEFLLKNGIKGTEDFVQNLFEEKYLALIQGEYKPAPCDDIKETMEFILSHGGTIAIVSAHSEKRIMAEARIFGLDNYVSVLAAESVSKAKDIARLCKKFKCAADETAYIGGTPFDIISANTVGVISVAKLGGYYSEKDMTSAKPRHVIRKFSDLMKIVPEYATS
jgi:phosphoglycolate phosphatase-like HAD superfamily hydrolase